MCKIYFAHIAHIAHIYEKVKEKCICAVDVRYVQYAGVVLKFAILKRRPNFLKEGQIARVLGRKEGQLESNYVL